MKYPFIARPIDVSAGGKKIAIINKEDAEDFDLAPMDRIRIRYQKREATAIVDISEKIVRKGELGCFVELTNALKLRGGERILIEPIEKPPTVSYIKRKLDGYPLHEKEIMEIIRDVMQDRLSEVELTALISAWYIRGLTREETLALTKAIVESGETLDLKRRPIMDKHCIGGVPGNRTSMIIVPIVAAAGLTIPKTSSRAITSPAGTADTMEVLAPVDLTKEEIERVVLKTNGCIAWGGGVGLAAADDKLIAIRRPLSLDPRGVLLASILAKKKAVGATHVLIDIPMGKGTKVLTKKEAQELAGEFMDLGVRLGMDVHCIITPGYDPIGYAVGPALEAREILRILEGENTSPDLRKKSAVMAGILLELGGKAKKGEGYAMANKIIENGKALEKLMQIVEEQGGERVSSKDIVVGDVTYDVVAEESGRIHYINNKVIAAIARAAGAPKNKGAGVYLFVEKGDKVKKGQKLFRIYAESERKLDNALEVLERRAAVEFEKIILGEFGTEIKPKFYEWR